uniref:CSON014130 protein n=1 Tax=Culicoides sonorensis TaxID=179676 RepID=A0A336M9N0_CULSO
MKNQYLILLFINIYLLHLSVCSLSALKNASNKHKNVLFIMVDDLRPAFRAIGDKNAITPNIDKLIQKSFYFTNTFAQQSLCAPSRNSILTSRRPDTLKLYDFYSYWRAEVGNFTTLPQYFKENGYFTYSIGKVFHPGASSNFTDDFPASWSLPTFHGKAEEFINSPICIDPLTAKLTNNLLCPIDLNLIPYQTLPDIESTNHGIKILHQAYRNATPFFIAIGYHKPHIPFMFPYQYLQYHDISKFNHPTDYFKSHDLPAVAWAPFNDLRKRHDVKSLNVSFPFGSFGQEFAMRIRQHYYASVTYIDDLIGKLFKKVDFENTVIVLVSDHGWSLGENAEWAKYTNFDVTLKVPLVIYDPEYSQERHVNGRQINEIVELVDVFPSIAELAGLPEVQTCLNENEKICSQGKSLVNLMKGKIKPSEFNAFSQYPRPGTYPSKYPNSDEPKLKDIQIMGYTIRTRQLRYTAWIPFDNENFKGDWSEILAEELYDHIFDDHEKINLSNRPEFFQIKRELFKKLEQKNN